MIRSIPRLLRSRMLAFRNAGVLRQSLQDIPGDKVPSYIVVTPHLVHLAPLASRNHARHVQPVFLANGISDSDVAWLSRHCPEVPRIVLHASLRRRAGSLITHGVVIDYLTQDPRALFCIQDADCFVTDASFWDSVTLDPTTEYAAGPFLRKGKGARPDFPETFLLCLNASLMRKYRHAYGITAESTPHPPRRAQRFLQGAGYPEGTYLETLKDYYDTLQQFWVASRHHGYRFRYLPGDGAEVHHIGGTSYLYRTFDDLAHWDYWPLNVHYFHLRLLELPACSRFRGRFTRLIDYHGSADKLLAAFPTYAQGWRRQNADLILEQLDAAVYYRDALS